MPGIGGKDLAETLGYVFGYRIIPPLLVEGYYPPHHIDVHAALLTSGQVFFQLCTHGLASLPFEVF